MVIIFFSLCGFKKNKRWTANIKVKAQTQKVCPISFKLLPIVEFDIPAAEMSEFAPNWDRLAQMGQICDLLRSARQAKMY